MINSGTSAATTKMMMIEGVHAVIGIGETLNQRFTLESELGRGGMGAVYRATDQILGRSVAIKVLKEHGGEEVGKKIRLEAQILARLLHDNVVRLYDFGEADGGYFLVMEEVDGTSFSRRWRLLPMAERLRVIAQTAEALDYAHHQGVIHRDVKPANVLLTAADNAKLSDFGLSMLAEVGDESGVVRGTPHYMSPEQGRGKRLDHRTDLYSLGVMLYECATGAVPFSGQAMAVIAQHINELPTPPRFKNPDVASTLETLILNLLSKDPDARPASGAAVAKALREEYDRERERRPLAASGVGAAAAGNEPTINLIGADETESRGAVTARYGPSISVPAPADAPVPVPAPMPVPVSATSKVASPLAREMLESVLADPLIVAPDERYLCGHYLAYLLGGSRRQGIFLSRPLDPRNADRARLMLAMTWLLQLGPGEGGANVKRAAALLDSRTDVRPALNPVVVMKYLATRESPTRRKRFRLARKQLLEASSHAKKAMVDTKGVLNPGLMPQKLDDLRRIAPARSDVDDQLVARWNRVSEVWRETPDFRQAVLGYATARASKDPCSADLWPEVVYPLIERARWQREFRPKHEAVWDYLTAKVLRVPDAGVRLDRLIVTSVPVKVAEEMDEAFAAFVDDPRLDDDAGAPVEEGDDRLASQIDGAMSIRDLAAETGSSQHRGLIRLTPPDPYRFTLGELRDLWREAMATLSAGKTGAARAAPVGPYRLAVIPSIRGRSAGQIAVQGMRNKQIELITPTIRGGGSGARPLIAIWIYQDASAAIAYLDFKGTERFILWHAPNSQQFNFEFAADLNHELYGLGMEVPDQLDRALTKKFRPSGTS